MLAGIFYDGSGLGDQLFRYITVRTLAEKKGYGWGMLGTQNFKGDTFLNLDFGATGRVPAIRKLATAVQWNEKVVRDDNGIDIRSYDPEINFIQDNTAIDGSFEDDKYWRHNLPHISKWLAVEPLNVPDDVCVIGFRGGEYAGSPDLFLPEEYFAKAVMEMRKIKSDMKFEVHTDDPELAYTFFSNIKEIVYELTVVENPKISHSKHENMGFNWRSARHSKYAIIPNSAFFILPRILKHFEDPTAVTIAPRYWARRNTKTWARPACYYPEFTYI